MRPEMPCARRPPGRPMAPSSALGPYWCWYSWIRRFAFSRVGRVVDPVPQEIAERPKRTDLVAGQPIVLSAVVDVLEPRADGVHRAHEHSVLETHFVPELQEQRLPQHPAPERVKPEPSRSSEDKQH